MLSDYGTLYVLTNVAMPGLVKIGCTTGSIEDRIKDLSAGTGVPIAFECHFAARVPGFQAKERILHQLFGEQRLNPKREFFRIAPEKVVLAIRMGPHTELTLGKVQLDIAEEKAHERAIESEAKRRSRISLDAIGVQPGDVLTFSRDESVTATVVPGNKVEFQGQIMSLSASALKILQRMGSTMQAASGSDYWMYEGETLDEIRIAKEAQDTEVE